MKNSRLYNTVLSDHEQFQGEITDVLSPCWCMILFVLFCKFILPVCGVLDQSRSLASFQVEAHKKNYICIYIYIITITLTGGVIRVKYWNIYIYHPMNSLVMFTNLALEKEFRKSPVISSWATVFCELSIAIVVSLSSKKASCSVSLAVISSCQYTIAGQLWSQCSVMLL